MDDSDIPFCDFAATVAVTACYQNTFVFQRFLSIRSMNQFRKGRMALNYDSGVQRYIQFLADLRDSLRLVLSAAICQQDKGNAALLQGTESIRGAGYGF